MFESMNALMLLFGLRNIVGKQ